MNAPTTHGSRFNLLPMSVFSGDLNRWIDEVSSDSKVSADAPVGVWETDTHFYLEFDLPGVSVSDVDLKVVENVLHIEAVRDPREGVTYLRQERKFGSIDRQFSLPARIDQSNIGASMKAGVLKVSVPKAPESQVKKIEIKNG